MDTSQLRLLLDRLLGSGCESECVRLQLLELEHQEVRDSGWQSTVPRRHCRTNELVSHHRELFEQLADDLAKTLGDEQFVHDFLARGES